MDNILATILKDTFSLSQLKHRLRILKSNLVETLFSEATTTVSPADLNWLKSLPPTFYSQFNKDNIYSIFFELDIAVRKSAVLTVYLAFEPDDTTVSQIGLFARKTFLPSLLLDVKLDPNLIAGAALVWKGMYRDYSIKAMLEAKKAEILQGFKKFRR